MENFLKNDVAKKNHKLTGEWYSEIINKLDDENYLSELKVTSKTINKFSQDLFDSLTGLKETNDEDLAKEIYLFTGNPYSEIKKQLLNDDKKSLFLDDLLDKSKESILLSDEIYNILCSTK